SAERSAKNKRDKKSLVEDGRSHGVLLYDGDNAIGWCAYGLKQEYPRIDNGRNYKRLSLKEDSERLWRIACFFVDRDYRKKGVAKIALKAALDSIKAKGGGVVEAYPVTHKSARAWSKWSNWFSFGTESMFEREKFRLVGPILLQLAGLDPSQNFYTLVYRTNRVDVESALSDRVDHFFVQHQVLGVALGDDDSLVSLEAFDLACLIEALDLLVDPAYRLD